MRIINIVNLDTRTNTIIDITSFGVFEEQLSDEVVEQAEEHLIETAIGLRFGTETNTTESNLNKRDQFREEVFEAIEDGFYQIGDNLLSIVWSDI